MKLKIDAQGHVVVRDGLPVYVMDGGQEVAHDAGKVLADLRAAQVGRYFAASRFAADRMAIPADIAESYFVRHFKIEGGKPVAYDQHGNKLFSRQNHGEVAGFDEALEMLANQHPNRDIILRAGGERSIDRSASTPSIPSGVKAMPRPHFESMTPTNRAAFMKMGGRLTD